jgi:RimJ/RimL family protein N-acetyltransferase/predicted enzyme related to lactoylglutathione lyase
MGIAPSESFVIIYHEDMEAARQFYEGVLGLVVREVTYDWFVGYWVSDKHEMTLCISSSPEERALWGAGGKGVVIDFVVPDVDETYAHLVESGVEFLEPPTDKPWGLRFSCQAARRAAERDPLAAPPSAALCSPQSYHCLCGGPSSRRPAAELHPLGRMERCTESRRVPDGEHAVELTGLPIRTPSLVLRHFVLQDAGAVFALSNEATSRTWLPSQVYKDDAEAVSALKSLIRHYSTPANPRKGPYVLAIENRATGTLIGHVGFSPFGDDVEIGFAIAQNHQRRGCATEAIVAASCWIFQSFDLERIIAITSSENIASRRALLRARFAFERDEVMDFQGTNQSVSIYVLAGETPGDDLRCTPEELLDE